MELPPNPPSLQAQKTPGRRGVRKRESASNNQHPTSNNQVKMEMGKTLDKRERDNFLNRRAQRAQRRGEKRDAFRTSVGTDVQKALFLKR
jgi:hypothetical protein